MAKNKKNYNQKVNQMPPLTVDGKRQIIKLAISQLGEKQLSLWLTKQKIESLKYFTDHVRKYGPKYFRELYNLSQMN